MTWNTYDGTNAWRQAGGDFAPTALWSSVVNSPNTKYSWWATATVQGWLDGTVENDGLLLKLTDETQLSEVDFYGPDAGNPANAPTLQVVYEPQIGERDFYPLLSYGLTDRMGLAVNVANGNLVLHARDVAIAGTGLPLVVDRLFNDRAADLNETNELGPGWIHSTGSDIWLDPGVAGDGVVYHGAGGYAVFFQRNADGSFQAPPGEDATLVKNQDGSYTLTWHASGERDGFDGSGNLKSDTDRNGNTLSFAYVPGTTDTSTITDTQGRVLTFSYTNASYPNDVTQIADSTGRTWQYAYDAGGNLVTYTDPANQVTRYAYTNGDLTQVTDPLNNITTLSYYSPSPERVKAITFGSGTTVAGTYQFAYNAGKTVVTDPNNHNTTYFTDGRGRLTEESDALSDTFQWSWTSDNHVAVYTDGKNQQFTNVYDDTANPPTCSTQVGTHNLCKALLPSGAYTSWSYQDSAHPYYPTAATDPQGNQVTYAYDTPGNLHLMTDQLATQNQEQIDHNANGTVHDVIDFRGNTTGYGYDSAGNLTGITPPAPLGATTIGPDALSRPHTVTDGKNQQTTATFDALDRVTNTQYADGSTIATTPDADGNLLQMADNTGTTAWQYDARNRKTQKTLPGNRTISYGYDAASNLTSFADAGGQVAYHYNAVNLVDSLTEPNGLGQTSFGYDPNHRRTNTSFPGSGGVVQTVTYDISGRLSTLSAKTGGGTALTSYSLNYRKNGSGADTALPYVVTDTVNGRTVTDSYDVLNRLTEWKVAPTQGSGAQSHDYRYQYDGDGNRTSISADSVVSTLGYNAANEWTTDQAGGKTANYSYDADGNELGNDGFGDPTKALTITYNAKHQTASITDTRQHAIPMAYTGPGQAERVSAGWVASNPDTPGGSASYTYGSGLVNQTDSTGTTYYTRDPDGALISQRLASGAVYHYLTDWEGSVVALVDPAGTRQAGYFYCPTGNDAEPPTGPAASGNPWRMGGAFYDPGTKLYRVGGQYVDSNSGNATEVGIFCRIGIFTVLCPAQSPSQAQSPAPPPAPCTLRDVEFEAVAQGYALSYSALVACTPGIKANISITFFISTAQTYKDPQVLRGVITGSNSELGDAYLLTGRFEGYPVEDEWAFADVEAYAIAPGYAEWQDTVPLPPVYIGGFEPNL